MQNSPQACIFFSPTKPKIPKVCKFQVERSILSVTLALLCFGTSPNDIYKVDENSHFPIEKTVCILHQNLGFMINRKKSELEPCQNMQLLSMEINSIERTLTLSQEKTRKIVQQCQDLLGKLSASIRELCQLIGCLTSTAIVVLPAPLQYRIMQ